MGCAASKAAAASPPSTSESVPKPVAFEIPVTEEADKKVKKPPPQLLQRLEEQNNQNNLTMEEIEERKKKAEARRNQFLEEKARIARQAQKMYGNHKAGTPNGDKQDCKDEAEGS